MRIGLLLCDHVKPEYLQEFGDYPQMFRNLFPEFDFTCFDVIKGQFPTDFSGFDAFMATGSRHSVYENLDWIKQLKDLVLKLYQTNTTFIGFCFGHQLIGESLGGKVQKSEKGWCVGMHQFEIKESTSWMKPNSTPVNLLMMCQDQIQVLPQDSKVLMGNDICPNGMIQVGQHFLGIQGHPEFSKAYDQTLMEIRVRSISPETVNKGIESLQLEHHAPLIRDWVVQFIQEANQ